MNKHDLPLAAAEAATLVNTDDSSWRDDTSVAEDDLLEEPLHRWKFMPLLLASRRLKAALFEHAAGLARQGAIDGDLAWDALRAAAVTESIACHNGVGVLGLTYRRLVAVTTQAGQPALLVAEEVFHEWDKAGTPQFWLIAPAHHGLARAVAVGPSLNQVRTPG